MVSLLLPEYGTANLSLDFSKKPLYIKIVMQISVLEAIYHRRSVREFTGEPVPIELLNKIVRAGIWAPSGLNNQPWRFRLIHNTEQKTALAQLTQYGHVILTSPALIAVFLDQESMYDPVKDHQSAGACIQNMLLATHALDLGGVWLGQILKNKAAVNKILGITSQFDLMAIIAVGHPKHRDQRSTRLPIDHFLI